MNPPLPKPEHGQKSAPSEAIETRSAHGASGLTPHSSMQGIGDEYPFLKPAQSPDELGWLGQYRVLAKIGSGATGIVFRAEDPSLKRMVALKVLMPRYAHSSAAKVPFVKEARAQAAVEHDHVVAIFQVGEDRGVPYLAMPLLRGQTLTDALRQNGRPPPAEIVRIGRQIAEGLAAAHDQHLVHRDIKPANIWLQGSRRRVKILDFGLARADAPTPAEADAERNTRGGATVGTPAYMSPEQARGLPVDPRTDLFSLGVVMYEMATGELPFPGATALAILSALTLDPHIPARVKNPALPSQIAELIDRLLAKSPAQRPASAAAVADELEWMEARLSWEERTPGEASQAVADPWANLEGDLSVDIPSPVGGMLRHAETLASGRSASMGRGMRGSLMVWSAIGLIVLGAVGFTASQIYRLATPEGLVAIETDDPDAELIFRRDGREIRTRAREIDLPAGDYIVELASPKPGQRLSANRLTVHRYSRETVVIRGEVRLPVPTLKDTRRKQGE